ncbi:ATP-binding protein [Paenibacillus oryzisoli]|uniref:ATP-binding response regulator n=1 Tax=Paenibacillus oryzisoli TaxID=1850517 RepID=UPI003D293BCF
MSSLRRLVFPYRYVLLCLLLLGLFSGMRMLWNSVLFPLDRSYQAHGGIVDLRGVQLATSPVLSIDGEWEWFPGELLNGQQAAFRSAKPALIQVPGKWGNVQSDDTLTSYGVGTYRLRILTDPLERNVSFWFKNVQAAAEVELGGEVAGGAGKVAAMPADYVPHNYSFKASYSGRGTTEIELLVRVSNFDSPLSGGILRSVRFGSQTAIDKMSGYSIGFQWIIIMFLLLHGFYVCIVYLHRPKDRSLFNTGLVYVSVGIAIFSGHDKVLVHWLPISYAAVLKIRAIVLLWQNVFLVLVYRKFIGIQKRSRVMQVYVAVLSALSGVILVGPASYVNFIYDGYIFLGLYLFTYAWYIWTVAKMSLPKKFEPDVPYLLITGISIISNLAWSILETVKDITSVFYPIDLLIAVSAFSMYWIKKYLRNSDEIITLYEQLKIADKRKDQFLANTSHELRTPLHGIMNMTRSIYERERDKLDENSRKEMELVGTVSRRMSRLLDDLLDIVRFQEHRVTLRLEPLYVQAIVPGVMEMLRYMADDRPLELRMDISDEMPPIMADEKRFVQIVYNLLHNALKYTERGVIAISADVWGGMAEIRFADTGVGMDEETRGKIFARYAQGEHGIDEGSGIGLGLSICKQLVELHGGRIEVESELSRGTTFIVILPIADENAWSADVPLSEQEPVPALADIRYAEHTAADQWHVPTGLPNLLKDAPVHILAVDDDAINLNVLMGTLSSESYHVVTTRSGEAALNLLMTQSWDLLIADVMMPGMSGYELTQRVRERYTVSELPILLLTARSQPADIYTGFLSGANDYVVKPVDAVELRYRIRALISLKQSIHDRLKIEAAYLQAQIQPHFLFNTLNSLMVLSEIDTEKMRKLGEAFTSFLRVSFDYMNMGEKVDLAHELELVEAYLYIEKERFLDKLHIELNIDPELGLFLPPLSIQPLVENAVRHGAMGRVTGGTVTLKVARSAAGVEIEVRDTGVGMPPDKVAQLLDPAFKEKGGIGIANTNRRLIQHYGRGLTIVSRLGEGTVVSFVIPIP